MAAGYSGVGVANVTIAGGLSIADKTPLTAMAEASGTASTTLITVTAGKVAKILGFTLSGTSNGGGTYKCFIQKNGATKIIAAMVMYSNGAVQAQQAIAGQATAANAYEFAAGDVVEVAGNGASGQCIATIQYYEEDA